MGLEGRVAVITGPTGILGRVAAHRFAQNGARVALLGRDAARLEELARELPAPDRVLTYPANMVEPGAAASAAEAITARFGRPEIILHLVGGWRGGSSVIEVRGEDVQGMLDQHLWTTFHVAQAFAPHLIDNRWGRLIVVSSPYAAQPRRGGLAYAVGKSAQEALVMTLAEELKGTGVTANVILVRQIAARSDGEKEQRPGVRTTTPDEIAAAMLYLCSDEGGIVNGARLPLF
jgi:NAD(P)-dependent dehydrogenase (short-subunit alcohol dehydrogenase family)